MKLSKLGNNQVQDILEELGMIENGSCPYTAEELFKAGMEYNINNTIEWLNKNLDLEHDYPSSNSKLIEDYKTMFI